MRPPDESRVETSGTPGDARGADELLGALLPAQTPHGPVLFVGARPGDVVQGASWLLRRSPGAHVVHVVDEAPRILTVGPGGRLPPRVPSSEEESLRALALAGLAREQLLSLGARAQQASLSLVPLTECLMALLKALRPALLVGPPYTGVEPDDDATAFISHAAVALMARAGRTPPMLVEVAESFLTTPRAPLALTVSFTEADRAAKQRMLACHGSRADEWRSLLPRQERYRLAPHYDFTRPAREGPRPGEGRDDSGTPWRSLARRALEELKLPETPWH